MHGFISVNWFDSIQKISSLYVEFQKDVVLQYVKP